MNLINITETLQYDTDLSLWQQAPDVQEFLTALMETEPESAETEACLAGFVRPLKRTWKANGSGAKITEEIAYIAPADSNEFMGVKTTYLRIENGA